MFETTAESAPTRDRLIAAAGTVFARDGFRAAGMREICRLAGANLASVKYYFGSKLELYRATILAGVKELGPPKPQAGQDVETFLAGFLSMTLIRRHRHPYLGSVMKHELREPTEVLDEVVAAVLKPLHRQFSHCLAERLGISPTSKQASRLAAFSLSFCANLETSRPVLERLGLEFPADEKDVPALAKEVTAFLLHGASGAASLPDAKRRKKK